MRFTAVLRMPMRRRMLQDMSWFRWRKPAINDLGMEEKLRAQNIQVVDANDYVREMDKDLYPPDWRNLPNLDPVFPQPQREDRTHPNWHDEPILVFDWQSFPMEGVNQAQTFTKSVQVKEGLPDSLLERCTFENLQNPEGKAEQIIKQAFLWDAALEKLPNLMDFDYPTRKFRRPIGIPLRRSNDILVRNFLRLMEQDNPDTALSRALSNDEEFRVNVKRHGYPVQFKLAPLFNVMAKTPLLPFVDPIGVRETESQKIPDIYPFLSTTNFDDRNIYEENDFLAVSPNSTFPHIHTSVFSHHIPGSHTHIHPRWNDDRFAGTTILYAFASAALMAHRRFGNSSAILPEPVTSQVVHLTGKELQFAVFQLNTLDLEEKSTSKVTNIVWLTEKIKLFSRVENKLGTEIFEGYNPEPFKILKGIYSSPTS